MKLSENWSIVNNLGTVSIYSNNLYGKALQYVVTVPKENVEISNRKFNDLKKAKLCRDEELFTRIIKERQKEIPKMSRTGLSTKEISKLMKRISSRP